MISPCQRQCIVDRVQNRCATCKRTIHEITTWGRMTDQQRQQIIEQLKRR